MKAVKKCVIPVAGFGTRFLPATKALPKEMFPIIDKPVMQYLVEEAVGAGCTEIIIVTGRNKRTIEDHFDSNYELEKLLESGNKFEGLESIKSLSSIANISYIRQPYPRGDGDAVLRTKPFLGNEPFLVLFGDDLVFNSKSAARQLLEEFNRKNAPVIATTTVKDEDVSSYGIIEGSYTSEKSMQVKNFKEKPSKEETDSRHGVIGKYILTPEIFDYLEKIETSKKTGEIRLADAFEQMLQDRDIYGLDIEGERYDTGSKIGFIQATIKMATEREDLREETIKYIKSLDL